MNEATTQKKSKIGDIIKFVVFIGIGFFFIYWFLLKLSPEEKESIWLSFKNANYAWVAAAMGVCLLSHFVRALRWRLLYEPLGKVPRIHNTFGAVVVAYMANLAFPRLGEVLRCAVLKTSDDIAIEKSLGTVVTERMIDVLAFFVIVLLGLLVMLGTAREWLQDALLSKMQRLPNMAIACGIALFLLAILVFAYVKLRTRLVKNKIFKKIDNIIAGCLDGVKSILHLGKRNAWLFVLYSLLIYFFYIAGGLVIFQAFGETHGLGMGAAFVLYLFGSVGMGLSQGGLGVYPVLVQKALALYGISLEVGTAAGWLLWGSQQVIIILTGFAFLTLFAFQKKNKNNNTVQSL